MSDDHTRLFFLPLATERRLQPGEVDLSGLDAMAANLNTSSEIIAYCRGPYCVYAHQAVARLRQLGLEARRLEGGLPEWRADGRHVVTDLA